MLAITESGNIDKSNPAIEGPAGIALYGGAQTMQDQLEDDSVFGAYGEKTPDIPSIAEEKTIWTPWETTKIVKDLCKVKWGQKGMKDFYLYNKYCPSAGGDSMCYAGCIPVSVAHVMSVHKYPSSYKGYTFDWDKLNKFRGEWGVPEEETGEQLAHLLAELGSKDVLHTYYGPNSSGTEFSKITQGFKSFGYSNWGHQEDYIEDHIISELDAGYPVMIGGFAKRTTARFLGIKTGYNYDKGHSWVVHGYMVQERDVKTYQRDKLIKTVHQKVIYMQCNWGWNGKDDGFFLSHAFSPEEGYAFKDDGKTEGDHYASPYAKDYNYQYHLLVNLGMRK